MSVGVTAAVEGDIDEAIAARLLEHAGLTLEHCHVTRGQPNLLRRLTGFNRAAQFAPWFVLTDLDGGPSGRCAPDFVREHMPDPAPQMRFRVAVQQAEAWLLADAAGIAEFLSVHESHVPRDPDRCLDAKDAMVALASRSRSRAMREAMIARPGSGRRVGTEYASLMIEFALYRWSPGTAAARSNSLARAVERLRELAD